MKYIWKYDFQITDEQTIVMPAGAKLLSVAVQNGKPVIWAEVDPSKPSAGKTIYVFGTGHPIDTNGLRFIGTVQLVGGSFVGHVYGLE